MHHCFILSQSPKSTDQEVSIAWWCIALLYSKEMPLKLYRCWYVCLVCRCMVSCCKAQGEFCECLTALLFIEIMSARLSWILNWLLGFSLSLSLSNKEYDYSAEAWPPCSFYVVNLFGLFGLLFVEAGLLMILQVLDPCLDSACADDQTDSVIVEYDDFVKVLFFPFLFSFCFWISNSMGLCIKRTAKWRVLCEYTYQSFNMFDRHLREDCLGGSV